MRRLLLIPALCAAAAAAGPAAAAAARAVVPISHAARLQVPGVAGSVIVGDPAVVDAIVINPHTIYVQGKTYGQTGIVVLDREGHEVWHADIAVISPGEGGRVTVVRGAAGMIGNGPVPAIGILVNDYTCADVCTPVVPAPAPK